MTLEKVIRGRCWLVILLHGNRDGIFGCSYPFFTMFIWNHSSVFEVRIDVLASFMTYASEHLAIRSFLRGLQDRDSTLVSYADRRLQSDYVSYMQCILPCNFATITL